MKLKEYLLSRFHGMNVDKKLMKNMITFKYQWINKSMVHVDYLTSNLVGVHPIRFTEEDDDNLFFNVLRLDRQDVQDELYKLDDVYKDRIVASNATYIMLCYIMSLTIHSKLSKKDKETMLETLYEIMVYKMVSSILFRYFPFPLDIDIATTVYELLTRKYLIKKLGSWDAVFKYRSKDVKTGGLHFERLRKYDMYDIVINDIQGRYRSIHKELYAVINKVIEDKDKRISISLNTTTLDGDETLGDIENIAKRDYDYIFDIVGKKEDFVKGQLVNLIVEIYKNVDGKELTLVLNSISDNYLKNKRDVDKLIDYSLKASISYLHSKKINPPYDERAVAVIRHLKGLWSGSRVSDRRVKEAKELSYKFSLETGKKTRWLLTTLGMSINTYIFIRTLMKDRL